MMSFDVFLRNPSEKDDVFFTCRISCPDCRQSAMLGEGWNEKESEKLEHAGEDSGRRR
jgi:hypothetical protein